MMEKNNITVKIVLIAFGAGSFMRYKRKSVKITFKIVILINP